MSIIVGSIILLGLCLCAFVYIALMRMTSVSLRKQRQTLAFILIAGVLGAAAQIRALTDALLVGADSYLFGLLVEVPAAIFLLLAAWTLLRSEREEISALRRSATVDPLTSLYNQAHFRRAAERRLIQSREYEFPLSLAVLDIDDFESYDRDVGNTTLRNVADILKRSVRADDLVARYGGEEFVMLLNCELDDASNVFERVRSNVESYSGAQSIRHAVTVSIGLTGYGEGRENGVEEILEEADVALDHAKRDGKNRVVSYPEVA